VVAESLSSAHTADAPATVISVTAPRRRFLLARRSAGSAQGLPSPRPSLRPRLTAESGGFRPRQASHEPAARVVGRSRATDSRRPSPPAAWNALTRLRMVCSARGAERSLK
jgi:hypothetical protein